MAWRIFYDLPCWTACAPALSSGLSFCCCHQQQLSVCTVEMVLGEVLTSCINPSVCITDVQGFDENMMAMLKQQYPSRLMPQLVQSSQATLQVHPLLYFRRPASPHAPCCHLLSAHHTSHACLLSLAALGLICMSANSSRLGSGYTVQCILPLYWLATCGLAVTGYADCFSK